MVYTEVERGIIGLYCRAARDYRLLYGDTFSIKYVNYSSIESSPGVRGLEVDKVWLDEIL